MTEITLIKGTEKIIAKVKDEGLCKIYTKLDRSEFYEVNITHYKFGENEMESQTDPTLSIENRRKADIEFLAQNNLKIA